MTKENNNCDGSCKCVRGIGRREFLKMAAAAGLLVGCNPTQQPVNPTTVPTLAPTAPPTEEEPIDVYVAYCGYDGCPTCPKYERSCDGCLTNDGQLAPYAVRCTVRNCNVERGVANCGTCEEYACDKLDKLFAQFNSGGFAEIAEQAQATLEEINQSLSQ